MRFEVQGLGFGVWGLGFGVWGLRFGAWVWGFRFRAAPRVNAQVMKVQ